MTLLPRRSFSVLVELQQVLDGHVQLVDFVIAPAIRAVVAAVGDRAAVAAELYLLDRVPQAGIEVLGTHLEVLLRPRRQLSVHGTEAVETRLVDVHSNLHLISLLTVARTLEAECLHTGSGGFPCFLLVVKGGIPEPENLARIRNAHETIGLDKITGLHLVPLEAAEDEKLGLLDGADRSSRHVLMSFSFGLLML